MFRTVLVILGAVLAVVLVAVFLLRRVPAPPAPSVPTRDELAARIQANIDEQGDPVVAFTNAVDPPVVFYVPALADELLVQSGVTVQTEDQDLATVRQEDGSITEGVRVARVESPFDLLLQLYRTAQLDSEESLDEAPEDLTWVFRTSSICAPLVCPAAACVPAPTTPPTWLKRYGLPTTSVCTASPNPRNWCRGRFKPVCVETIWGNPFCEDSFLGQRVGHGAIC